MAKNAFFMIEIEHEFSHGNQSYLYFLFPNKFIFNLSKKELIIIKLNKNVDNKIINKEDNKSSNINVSENKETKMKIEYIEEWEFWSNYYINRIINILNINECIYILLKENYKKSLNKFRKGFINLKDKKLIEVLEDASKKAMKK